MGCSSDVRVCLDDQLLYAVLDWTRYFCCDKWPGCETVKSVLLFLPVHFGIALGNPIFWAILCRNYYSNWLVCIDPPEAIPISIFQYFIWLSEIRDGWIQSVVVSTVDWHESLINCSWLCCSIQGLSANLLTMVGRSAKIASIKVSDDETAITPISWIVYVTGSNKPAVIDKWQEWRKLLMASILKGKTALAGGQAVVYIEWLELSQSIKQWPYYRQKRLLVWMKLLCFQCRCWSDYDAEEKHFLTVKMKALNEGNVDDDTKPII